MMTFFTDLVMFFTCPMLWKQIVKRILLSEVLLKRPQRNRNLKNLTDVCINTCIVFAICTYCSTARTSPKNQCEVNEALK